MMIAGRNRPLQARLEAARARWERGGKNRVHVYGFVTHIPRLMAAADILVTRAGPGTISEACAAGVPFILFNAINAINAIPAQEEGNVAVVVARGIGAWAPGPRRAAGVVERWVAQGPDALCARAQRARAFSRPDVVWKSADTIWEYARRLI